MIILTEKQAEERLNNPDNLSVIIVEKRRGNHTGESRREIGDVKTVEEKQLMAACAIENKLNGISIKETAAEFGIAPTTLGEFIHGKYTNNPGDDNSVRKPNRKNVLVADKVADVIARAIDGISDIKLEKCDAVELSTVAQKMASVTEKLSDKRKDGVDIKVNIYAPQLLTEASFSIVNQ